MQEKSRDTTSKFSIGMLFVEDIVLVNKKKKRRAKKYRWSIDDTGQVMWLTSKLGQNMVETWQLIDILKYISYVFRRFLCWF